jgi:hypothetical protein
MNMDFGATGRRCILRKHGKTKDGLFIDERSDVEHVLEHVLRSMVTLGRSVLFFLDILFFPHD